MFHAVLLLVSCSVFAETDLGRTETQPVGRKVVGVLDGDTLEVQMDNAVWRVTVFGADAPELGQKYGPEAKRFTQKLAAGRLVQLEVMKQRGPDHVQAKVTLPDGKDLAAELIRHGLAWWYPRHGGSDPLAKLEMKALEKRRGLWKRQYPLPPWQYRIRKQSFR